MEDELEEMNEAVPAMPMILRIAGLSASDVRPVGGADLLGALEARFQIARSLSAARADMIDWLYRAIPDAAPAARRLMLSVKRDCFRGRSLRDRLRPQDFDELPADLASRIVEHEERLEELDAAFESTFRSQEQRELEQLCELLADPELLRGLATASPVLVTNLHRLLETPIEAHGRRERRLVSSLVRYVSRAAFKCSPFATLTRTGYGEIDATLHRGGVRLADGPWQSRSVCRLRYPINRLRDLLIEHPPFRAQLQVALNDTVRQVQPERFSFLRPSHWAVDEDEARFRRESMVTVKLKGPVIDWLRDRLTSRRFTYRELLTALADDFDGDEAVADVVDRLIHVGFLELRSPWSSDSTIVEQQLLAYVRSLGDDQLAGVEVELGRIEAEKSRFPGTTEPMGAITRIEAALRGCCEAAGRLCNIEVPVKTAGSAGCDLSEDVFLTCRGAHPEAKATARLPLATAQTVLQSAQPLFQFSHLFSRRYEFLYSFAALFEQRWPGRSEASFLEVYAAALPLWRQFEAAVGQRQRGVPDRPFNPMRLAAIEELHRLQTRAWAAVAAGIESRDGDDWLSADVLGDVLASVPARYAPTLGACLFIQPADAAGDTWVLNRMFEGTGRYGSRFAALMDPHTQQVYTEHMAARSTISGAGEEMELLDLMSTRGSMLNVHPLQTNRVLEVPGERLDSSERRVGLRDLRLRVDQPLPRLTGRTGTAYLPVHLGHMNIRYLTPLLRFMILFGPSSYETKMPPQNGAGSADLRIFDRLRLGPLVLRRKRWAFAPASLLERISGSSDARALVEIDDWRRSISMPPQVFAIEKVARGAELSYKPQYLDLASPLHVQLLISFLQRNRDAQSVTIEEMLPTTDQYPADQAGRRWAVELQLDSLALREAGARPLTNDEEGSKDARRGRIYVDSFRRATTNPSRSGSQVEVVS